MGDRKGTDRSIFVSYNFTGIDGRFGFGNTTQFTTPNDFIVPKDILKMQEILERQQDFRKVVILNYQIM